MWDGTVEAAVFRLSPQAQLAGRATPPPGAERICAVSSRARRPSKRRAYQ